MNDQAWKMAVDGLESAIASREVDLERLKMQRDAMRWREKASVEIERLTAERNEARAEVERLTKERDEAKTLAESYRKQGEADWNACCDVLIWARRFAKDLPPPSRAVTAVLELLQKTQQERDTARGQAHEAILVNKALFDGDSIPASHAEKVLVDVAKAAARLGAEGERARLDVLVQKEENFATERRKQTKTKDAWEYWEGRRTQATNIRNAIHPSEGER